jgi:hypothetical protein
MNRRVLAVGFAIAPVALALLGMGWVLHKYPAKWGNRSVESGTFYIPGREYEPEKNDIPITKAAFKRIRLGMTMSEVEEAIGGSSGAFEGVPIPVWGAVEAYAPTVREMGMPEDEMWKKSGDFVTVHRWAGKSYWIHVAFDQDEKVVGCYLGKASDGWWR